MFVGTAKPYLCTNLETVAIIIRTNFQFNNDATWANF